MYAIRSYYASHLLGEIERVCDHLIAIDGGRLVRSAEIGVFTAQTAALAVGVDHGLEELRGWLGRAGLEAEDDGKGGLLVPLAEDGRAYDLVRDGASELGLPLVRMERRITSYNVCYTKLLRKPIQICSTGSTVNDILNMAVIAACKLGR